MEEHKKMKETTIEQPSENISNLWMASKDTFSILLKAWHPRAS